MNYLSSSQVAFFLFFSYYTDLAIALRKHFLVADGTGCPDTATRHRKGALYCIRCHLVLFIMLRILIPLHVQTVRVAVFADKAAADEARAAGADIVGGEELIEEIKNGNRILSLVGKHSIVLRILEDFYFVDKLFFSAIL